MHASVAQFHFFQTKQTMLLCNTVQDIKSTYKNIYSSNKTNYHYKDTFLVFTVIRLFATYSEKEQR